MRLMFVPHLRARFAQILNDQKLEQTPEGKARKNMALIVSIVNQLAEAQIATVPRLAMVDYVRQLGLDGEWMLNSAAKDEHDLTRAISDLLGGHGLHLERNQQDEWMIPKGGVTDEALVKLGIHPDSCTHRYCVRQ